MMYDRWLQRDGRGLVGAKEGHSTAKVSRQLSVYISDLSTYILSIYLSIYLSTKMITLFHEDWPSIQVCFLGAPPALPFISA